MIKQAITRELKDYVNITLGLMLYTFGFTVFLLPYEIVTGGIAGIGAVVFYATKFPVQYTFFIINAVLIVAALKILGWRFLMKTIYATFMLTFLLEVAQDVVMQPDGTFYKLLGEGNDFMSLVIGCMMTGTALAVVFRSAKNGLTTGVLLAVARVAGETAPLLFTALTSDAWPTGFFTQPTANLTVTMTEYATNSPFEEMHVRAWGAAFLITTAVLILNLLCRTILREKKS